jgi:hypothetical protein
MANTSGAIDECPRRWQEIGNRSKRVVQQRRIVAARSQHLVDDTFNKPEKRWRPHELWPGPILFVCALGQC